MEKKQDQFSTQILTKVEEEELYEIRDLILKLPKVSETDALKNYVQLNIENFKKDNINF